MGRGIGSQIGSLAEGVAGGIETIFSIPGRIFGAITGSGNYAKGAYGKSEVYSDRNQGLSEYSDIYLRNAKNANKEHELNPVAYNKEVESTSGLSGLWNSFLSLFGLGNNESSQASTSHASNSQSTANSASSTEKMSEIVLLSQDKKDTIYKGDLYAAYERAYQPYAGTTDLQQKSAIYAMGAIARTYTKPNADDSFLGGLKGNKLTTEQFAKHAIDHGINPYDIDNSVGKNERATLKKYGYSEQQAQTQAQTHVKPSLGTSQVIEVLPESKIEPAATPNNDNEIVRTISFTS